MATAAPHVKLLRQLSDARDDYLSGALDLGWEGGHATLFMVFGQPSHAVFQSDVRGTLEGSQALSALLGDLPGEFTVGPWRRAMAPSETLDCSVDDLVAPLAQLAGAHAHGEAEVDTGAAWQSAGDDDSPDLAFDQADFPLLPAGDALWVTAPAPEVGLPHMLPGIVSGLVTLNGPRLSAAGIIDRGQIVDAVWVDDQDRARGEAAAMALLGAREGTLAGIRLPGAEIAGALTMLWRLSVEQRHLDPHWLDPPSFLDSLSREGSDRVVMIGGPSQAVGLFVAGRLAGMYSSADRHLSSDPQRFRGLLAHAEGRLTILGGPKRGGHDSAPARRAPAVQDPDPPRPGGDASGSHVPGPAAVHGSIADPDPNAEPSPLGVDFGEVRRELIQIGVSWLGERDGEPVLTLLKRTRPSIDDFVATLDVIRTLDVDGYEPSVVHSMAREMHFHAAERLCGA